MSSTDIGRTASHFYLNAESIDLYNREFKEYMTEADIFAHISQYSEFENIQVRTSFQSNPPLLLPLSAYPFCVP